jgi:glutaconate CoA-transferase subunit B
MASTLHFWCMRMVERADQFTAVLAREFLAAAKQDPPLTIVAVTTVSSLVAALAAKHLGATELATAVGFGTLDADAVPTLSLLESGLHPETSPKGPPSDTFVALARGWVGVVVQPAQLDARAQTNLSRVGGSNDIPALALPGSRGLPENNDTPSRVWYLLPDHSPRQLVAEVDFVSGPEPSAGRMRRLITCNGVFEYHSGGWHAVGLFDGADRTKIGATAFEIGGVDSAPVIAEPSDEELAAFAAVDPSNMRSIEFAGREGASKSASLIAEERSQWRPA